MRVDTHRLIVETMLRIFLSKESISRYCLAEGSEQSLAPKKRVQKSKGTFALSALLGLPSTEGRTSRACFELYPLNPRFKTSALLEYLEDKRLAHPIFPSTPKPNSVIESPKSKIVGLILIAKEFAIIIVVI